MKDQMLNAEIQDEKLVLSIGTEMLISAAEYGRCYGAGTVEISDQKEFLENLRHYILKQEEDLFTPFHCMIDDCVREMIEQGETGLEYTDDQE